MAESELNLNQDEKVKYKQVSPLVARQLQLHTGERFTLDDMCKWVNATTREGRTMVAIKLNNEAKAGILEKLNNYRLSIYRYIDSTIKEIDWVNAGSIPPMEIRWPYGREDGTRFGFDGCLNIYPKDVIVVAGVSNMGKTTFMLNFLWENMDNHSCFLMGNEYQASKFKDRALRMCWNSPVKENGLPKFTLVERHKDWKDIIRPDHINLIDWMPVNTDFYQVGQMLEDMQEKLTTGLLVVALQKSRGKDLGAGGQFSEHLASLYVTLDFQRLTIMKGKAWRGASHDGTMYRFKIADGGARFEDIHEITKCRHCYGTGTSRGQPCDDCSGTGYVDKLQVVVPV